MTDRLTPAEVLDGMLTGPTASEAVLRHLADAGYEVVPEDRVVPDGYRLRPPHMALTRWAIVPMDLPVTKHEQKAWDRITEGADGGR